MAQIPLSLGEAEPRSEDPQQPPKSPVMGWFAVAFGFLGIFTIGFIFVPLGLICSLFALFMGQAMWGFIGVMLAVAGFVTSPKLWLIVGMGAFYAMFDWPEFMQPFIDFLNSLGFGDTTQV